MKEISKQTGITYTMVKNILNRKAHLDISKNYKISNFSKYEVYDMLENEDMLADRANICYFDAGVPDYKRDYDYPYWEDTLYYLIDESEENLAFAKKCAEKMNIDEAIKKVEKKIQNKIPSEYKDFARIIWDNRLQNICECLGLDYYKIMDNKYYENEMEEIQCQ